MASYLDLIDNSLEKDFDKPVYNPSKGRAKAVAAIDNAANQHKEGRTPPTRAWKVGSNNAISFALTVSGSPVPIGGKERNFIPAERFQDFLKGLKADVEAGKLDNEIQAALEGDAVPTKAGKASGASAGKYASLGSVKKALGRLKDQNEKTIREYLEGKGVREDWIDETIADWNARQGK